MQVRLPASGFPYPAGKRRDIKGAALGRIPTSHLLCRSWFRILKPEGIQYHNLRTRQSAAHRFISVHVPAPGALTVHQGHGLLERPENELLALPNLTISTHLEPLEDPASARKH